MQNAFSDSWTAERFHWQLQEESKNAGLRFFSLQAHERDSLRELPPTRHPPSRRNYKKIDDERGATFFSRRELLSNATAGNYWLHRARAFRRKKRIQDFINPDRVKSVRGRERERSARLAAQLSTQRPRPAS